mgnify:FL=1
MWTVTDNESGIAIDIREGLFNDSQDVVICLKFTTFVVATTVHDVAICEEHVLWFA